MAGEAETRHATAWVRAKLGYRFREPALLEHALTHRSAGAVHNERLEFLGDAVLGLAAAELLYARRPEATEGTLTRLRARLVRRETLATIARRLELGPLIRLGSGELRSGGHQRGSILANALEAVIGAICLDGGYEEARSVVAELLAPELAGLPADDELRDPKTRLQEHIQSRGLPLPVYEVTGVTGAAHEQNFSVVCRLDALGLRVEGSGTSRRNAEQQAAERALAALVAHD